MRNILIGAVLAAGLAVPSVAPAQRHGDNWWWTQRDRNTFANRGQCQRALMAERNSARMEARRHGYTVVRFNNRWRLTCLRTRGPRGRVMWHIG